MQSAAVEDGAVNVGTFIMPATKNNGVQGSALMSDRVFSVLSEFIHSHCGIKMPPGKKTMLEGRLRKRLRALDIESFETYCEYLFNSREMQQELISMLDVVTTNKTDFFRESAHFDLLLETVLPECAQHRRNIGIWSAGCSTGEEPYTLAMVLSEFAESFPISFSILATDISTKVLEKARQAIYEHEKVEPVPIALKKKYLLRGKGDRKGLVRIRPELRTKVRFGRLNLMDPDFPLPDQLDVIFCRNVMIYFDRETQGQLARKFCMHLAPGGYLFTGHSETLQGHDLPLTPIAPTVHRRI